tara:strand:- start:233 stop:643 length:411 start_codon:yes stop_codon:yes gene_type:complete
MFPQDQKAIALLLQQRAVNPLVGSLPLQRVLIQRMVQIQSRDQKERPQMLAKRKHPNQETENRPKQQRQKRQRKEVQRKELMSRLRNQPVRRLVMRVKTTARMRVDLEVKERRAERPREIKVEQEIKRVLHRQRSQ